MFVCLTSENVSYFSFDVSWHVLHASRHGLYASGGLNNELAPLDSEYSRGVSSIAGETGKLNKYLRGCGTRGYGKTKAFTEVEGRNDGR